jgi:hypothetical protein
VVLIFIILFVLYGNFRFPATIALGVIMTEPVGAQRPLKLTPPREADGVAAATASDHDDRFGRVSRVAAGGALDRHQLGYAETVRDRDCCGSDFALVYWVFRESDVV